MSPSLKPLRESVLVVDDEPEIIDHIRHLLEKHGFHVTVAESVEAGLRDMSLLSPQLVLTDVALPEMGGIEVVNAVLRHDPDTPVIVMTAQKEVPKAIEAVRRGAFHYIRKPFGDDELLALCVRAAETWRLRAENKNLRQLITSRHFSVSPAMPRSEARPERTAMERAAFARLTEFVGEAIRKLPTRVLEQALSERAAPGTLTDVMAGVLLQDPVEGEWAAALLKGAKVQRELLEEAHGALSGDQVASLLGIGRAAVDKRRRQGTLLGIKLPSNDVVYPAAQFGPRDVLRGLPEVLDAFRIEDPWMQLDMLLAKHDILDGRTGFQALKDGDVEPVKRLVASVGEQGL